MINPKCKAMYSPQAAAAFAEDGVDLIDTSDGGSDGPAPGVGSSKPTAVAASEEVLPKVHTRTVPSSATDPPGKKGKKDVPAAPGKKDKKEKQGRKGTQSSASSSSSADGSGSDGGFDDLSDD